MEPAWGTIRLHGMRALVVTSLFALLVAGCSSPTNNREIRADSSGSTSPVALTGPLGGDSATSCVENYSAAAIAGRGFAFDGTVVSIGPGTTNRPGKGRLSSSAVTFTVEQWFTGGSGSTMTIDMSPPREGPRLSEAAPTYDAGTRLLVSGESRWGEGISEDGLAWGCGFTRYYDPETAGAWLAATE